METVRDPNQVLIFDTTLRDGDQTPGISFGIEDKVEIAQRLSKLGVDIIEAGFPFAVEGDFEAVRTIAETVDGPVICALSRTGHNDIEAAWEAIEPARYKGGARIHTFIATSELHMTKKLEMTPDDVVSAAASAVRKAREYTEDVEFSPEDASRSDFDFMMRVVLEAVEAGATTINIPDTVGYAVPAEYGERIATVKELIDERYGKDHVVISAHCHDDLGLATANTLAAVEAGARQTEVAVASLGERAGNTSLEQVVAGIRQRADHFNGLHSAIDTRLLNEISREVMRRAGILVPPNTPIIGANAFAHEAGIHQDGVSKDLRTYEHMNAEDYGQEAGQMVIGKLSGKAGIENRLNGIGVGVSLDILKSVRSSAKKMADNEGRRLADSDIEALAAQETGEIIVDRCNLKELSLSQEDGVSAAKVAILDTSESAHAPETAFARSANGTIDAAVQAINQALSFSGDIEAWHGDSQESGSDAQAGVYVVVKQNGHRVEAYADSNSVDEASIRAYVKAINLIDRVNHRKQETIAA